MSVQVAPFLSDVILSEAAAFLQFVPLSRPVRPPDRAPGSTVSRAREIRRRIPLRETSRAAISRRGVALACTERGERVLSAAEPRCAL